ncbi:MAG: YeiH family protein [Pseudobdellovibrionaceae bacterium]
MTRELLSSMGWILIPIGFMLSMTPLVNSAGALTFGIFSALICGNPYIHKTRKWTRPLLAWSIVALGAGVNLLALTKAGTEGILFTALGLSITLGVGHLIGKVLKTNSMISILTNVGTAICGGSAIASVSSALGAKDRDISVSLGIIFILNAIALVIFPPLGHAFGLSENQFGLWAALAIHDTSSVVGATLQYGSHALEVGVTVKLVRALWIIPVTLLLVKIYKKADQQSGALKFPWFILGFLMMSAAMTWIPFLEAFREPIATIGKHTLKGTLFLIGAGLTFESLKKVGARPLIHGIVLWFLVASGNLLIILFLTTR